MTEDGGELGCPKRFVIKLETLSSDKSGNSFWPVKEIGERRELLKTKIV